MRRRRPFRPGPSGSGGHPKDLKGQQIGKWYAMRNKSRNELENRRLNRTQMELGEASMSGEQRNDLRRQYQAEKKDKHEQELRNQIEREQKKPLGSILISEQKKTRIAEILDQRVHAFLERFLEKSRSCKHLPETDFMDEFQQHITGSIMEKLKENPGIRFQGKCDKLDQRLLTELQAKSASSSYQKMQKIRQMLPSMHMRQKILDLIENNQITVISGETGCGKTTQVSQFILDDFIAKSKGSECKIICTQPRRISAIAVAERVACERDEKLGNSVGFQIRLEKTLPRERGSILFCTTGVVLRYMESEPALRQVSHLILDEIHERDITSDFLITVLKDVVQYNSDIKIVLMSATLNADAFSRYYNGAPAINIPGFTHDVQEFFLEDVLQITGYQAKKTTPIWVVKRDAYKNREFTEFVQPFIRQLEAKNKYSRDVLNQLIKMESEQLDVNLVFELLRTICRKGHSDGAILVFLPGFGEINKLCNLLTDSHQFPPRRYLIIPLHSQLPTVDQKRIFDPPPQGITKIIIATNIAETSITIDDVTTVIDSGYIKVSNLDPATGIETLKPELVSQANAAQRRGRAGRVRPGVCYHMITSLRYQLLDKFLKPEVLRKRLEDVILLLKMMQLGDAESFLAKLMDPPEAETVKSSLQVLTRLGALNSEEALTPLGYHMAKLPMPAQCSKMLILATIFSCIDPILSVAASLGFKDAYQLSIMEEEFDADRKRQKLAQGTHSDHLCLHYAIRGFEEAREQNQFCREYHLSGPILRQLVQLRKQFAQDLFDMKLISDPDPQSATHNINSENVCIVKAIIAAGLYPNVAVIGKTYPREVHLHSRSGTHEKMILHKKSVLAQNNLFPSPLIVYYLRLKTSKIFVYDASVICPLSLVFFGDQFKIHTRNDNADSFTGVSVNNNIRFRCSPSTALVLNNLVEQLNQILEWYVSHPGFMKWNLDSYDTKVLRLIIDMITTEERQDFDFSDFEDRW
ncbi:ATP-dependent DNA/RNA helicase DHX36 [Dendroctonus ponderosae]|uniref:ATP-dependent DNA/RNA helicase DHX36 n=1 Tax=Dendroctonus ponderosae TaxID=77166 RepID=UPI002034D2AF|nr:ATP-dependent DNA/RNA helicase DHX36 [Dendroctonus ponderosae]XP_019770632.2 ATP-dependent DNA/RNA helicase DHX36 [Dendroctonus ponderosae]XP_019770633.2 ATP-dependent DNA/RNA helicase DHX36 [Dendroctonus ponderosae]XP_019770634.2 ATP-dependent DNA/RNA helicase DHX36 [Dendroctonus ponderosae]XP_048525237.1 ATP-dependent DNA/RNA helicase DHX36 [Dendroctonus ponderosae]KAH1010155.1 hypothetical protein HUJ05_004500 [Dendroctonus ponderosae]KAH1010156.1 hypothetical protein HUJ05_004500 [Dend